MIDNNTPYATAKVWRNLTSPSMKNAMRGKVSVYHGIFDSHELLSFSGDLNVRREKGGNVKKQILSTLEDDPANFRYLNGGITIVTRFVVEDKSGSDGVRLRFHKGASIINGTQTQGALRTYHGWDGDDYDRDIPSVEVDVTIIESSDDDLITDIAVARNVQNTVKDVSVFGRQGAFDSLNNSLASQKSPFRIATSETDNDHFETGKALQLIFALMPEEFWESYVTTPRNRPSLYSSKAKWMKYYGNGATDPKDPEKFKEVEEFAIDIIGEALQMYKDSQSASFWKVSRWKTDGIKLGSDGSIRVVDGFLIPFIHAHSVYVQKKGGKWSIELPSTYDPSKLIEKIHKMTKGSSDDSNPQTFGKKDESYEILEMTALMMKD